MIIKKSPTSYSLRYLANTMLEGHNNNITVPEPIQSPLEKFGKAMRYAIGTTQYYKRTYPYYTISNESIVKDRERKIQDMFSTDNGFEN